MNTLMPKSLTKYYNLELNKYRANLKKGNLQISWWHLERAHVIGQAYPIEHTYAHWEMLKFGVKIKSIKEIFGQIPRLLVGGVKSFVGKIPVGNTGGANIPPLKSLPISEDILTMFRKASIQ